MEQFEALYAASCIACNTEKGEQVARLQKHNMHITRTSQSFSEGLDEYKERAEGMLALQIMTKAHRRSRHWDLFLITIFIDDECFFGTDGVRKKASHLCITLPHATLTSRCPNEWQNENVARQKTKCRTLPIAVPELSLQKMLVYFGNMANCLLTDILALTAVIRYV